MQNPANKKKKENPIFKAGYNIQQRVALDEKMRNACDYAGR